MAHDKSRKELLEEPDPVTVYLHRMVELVRKYQKQLIVGGIAFSAVVLILSGVFFFLNRAEDKAALMFGRAMEGYEAFQAENYSKEAYAKLKSDFQEIIEQYGYTDSGKLALVQYASLLYAGKDYKEAVDAYKTAYDKFKRNSRFNVLLLNGLAYSYEASGDYENAIKSFEKIAADEKAAIREQALFSLGRLYGQIGNADKSRKAYEQIVSDYPDSLYYEPAKMQLAG